jgi:hypothetical protein
VQLRENAHTSAYYNDDMTVFEFAAMIFINLSEVDWLMSVETPAALASFHPEIPDAQWPHSPRSIISL